jgi:acyl dehydratase
MVEDANPLYTDEQFARSSQYGEVISPSVMARTWTMLPWWAPEPFPEDKPNPLTQVVELLDSASQIQVEIEEEYFLPIRLGDRLHCTTTILDVSPLKRTMVGPGHFVKYLLTYGNQREEVVGTLRATLLLLVRDAQ